ncbi:MAG TPA: BON domain-containing protein [Chloroflexota bacterium]
MIERDEETAGEVGEIASRLGENSITCTVDHGMVLLEGQVSSDERSGQIEEAVRRLPGVVHVENDLAVQGFFADVENEVEGIDLTGDFAAPAGSDDPLESVSEADPYFAPTDPVVSPSRDGEDLRMVNGFAGSADEPAAGANSMLPRGDAEIEADITNALRRDAATSDLEIRVEVENGVATLRGLVQSLEDAEAAEAVASTVPGVEEVNEEIRVEGM